MPRSTRSTCVVVAAVLLTVAACGSRADSTLRQQAAAAALGGTGGGSTGSGAGTGTGGTSTGGTATGGSTTGTGGSTSGTGTGAGSTSGTSTSGTGGTTTGATTGSSSGAPAPAGGNGGSTDVGVTGTSITVGNISDVSGPRPGLFAGAVTGTQAYFAKINSTGGIFGRQLKVDVGDSQLDCAQNKQKTGDRVNKVFAYVGSFSLFDDCGTDVLKTHTDIPDVHAALGAASQKLPNNFSIAPLGNGWRTGPLDYYAKTYGEAWKHVGAIYAGVGTGPSIYENVKAAIAHSGGAYVYTESYGATDTDFTATVVKMQQNGVQMIYVNTTDGPTGAYLVNAIRKQGLKWPIIFGATAYAPDFLTHVDSGADEGVVNDQQFAQFFNADEAAATPEVAEFQKWMKVANPNQQMDIFAAYGWASAELFVTALKTAGAKAKRADVMKALQGIHTFNSGGLFADADPSSKKPATCWILNTIKNHKFVRINPTSATYNCTGGFYVNPAAK